MEDKTTFTEAWEYMGTAVLRIDELAEKAEGEDYPRELSLAKVNLEQAISWLEKAKDKGIVE